MVEPDWRIYEQEIYERLKAIAGDQAEVLFDHSLPGNLSGVERQVDVYVKGAFPGYGKATMAVDCKHFARNVDVKHVETVMGLVEDVGTDFGLLVTSKGFSPAAKRRAEAARGMKLDVVPFGDLASWRPSLEWCQVCNDWDSDAFPGGVYLEPLERDVHEGVEFAQSAGRCERCQAIHVECNCGAINAGHEAMTGDWQECSGGCGIEWRFLDEVDSDNIPLAYDARDAIEFRKAS